MSRFLSNSLWHEAIIIAFGRLCSGCPSHALHYHWENLIPYQCIQLSISVEFMLYQNASRKMSIIKYQKPDTLHILGQLKTVYCHTLVLNIQNKLCPFILYVLIVIHKFKYFLKMYSITKVVYHQFYWLSFFKYNLILQ